MKAEETSRLDKLAEQAFAHDRNRLPEPTAAPSARLQQKLESSSGRAHSSSTVSATSQLGKFFGGAKLLGVVVTGVVGFAALYVTHVIGPVPQQSKPAAPQYTQQPVAPADSVRTDTSKRTPLASSITPKKATKHSVSINSATDTTRQSIANSNLPPIEVRTVSDSAHVTLRRRHHR